MKLEINNTLKQAVDVDLFYKAAAVFSKKMKISGDTNVSVALISATAIKKINWQYRGRNEVTDILSFSDGDGSNLGELLICLAQVKKQAREQKTSLEKELIFIFIHGLLHLCGYEDETMAGHKKMLLLGAEMCKNIMDSGG